MPMADPVDIFVILEYPGIPPSAIHWMFAREVPSLSSMNEKSLLSRRVLTHPLRVMGS